MYCSPNLVTFPENHSILSLDFLLAQLGFLPTGSAYKMAHAKAPVTLTPSSTREARMLSRYPIRDQRNPPSVCEMILEAPWK